MSTSRRNKRSLCLDRKLTAYTLAATAVVVAPQMMKADGITYVGNVNQTIYYGYDPATGTTSTTGQSYTLTLPGTNQFIDFNSTSIGNTANAGNGVEFLQAANGYPAALSAGALIDPSATGNFSSNGKLVSNGKFAGGNFTDGTTADLGFYFTEADGLHAGWASLTSVAPDANNYKLTLNSYAYNNVANQSILAGQTVATPEPASVSLIAMGAAGLAELRRRRRKYAEAA